MVYGARGRFGGGNRSFVERESHFSSPEVALGILIKIAKLLRLIGLERSIARRLNE
jgi:hypothetical protein